MMTWSDLDEADELTELHLAACGMPDVVGQAHRLLDALHVEAGIDLDPALAVRVARRLEHNSA